MSDRVIMSQVGRVIVPPDVVFPVEFLCETCKTRREFDAYKGPPLCMGTRATPHRTWMRPVRAVLKNPDAERTEGIPYRPTDTERQSGGRSRVESD